MKIIIYLAASANGMISNNRNVPDWLSQEYGQTFMELCQRTQAVIMGRTTYQILAPDYLPLKEGSLMVLTHDTETRPPQSNVLFTNDTPQKIVDKLASKGHREAVIIGGTQTVTAFIKAGLVNELILVVEPVLFGKGLLRNYCTYYLCVLPHHRWLGKPIARCAPRAECLAFQVD